MKLSDQPGFGKNDTATYPKIISNHEKRGHESLHDFISSGYFTTRIFKEYLTTYTN